MFLETQSREASPVLTFCGREAKRRRSIEKKTKSTYGEFLSCITQPGQRNISPKGIFIMFCRTFRTGCAARILRYNNLVLKSRRLVTTDAASSHAEKDDVPAVSQWAGIGRWHTLN